MHNQIASFRAALDARPVSRYQWLILLLLALLLVTDGYDAQVLGYVVPALAQGTDSEEAVSRLRRDSEDIPLLLGVKSCRVGESAQFWVRAATTRTYAPGVSPDELTIGDYLRPLGIQAVLEGKTHVEPNFAALNRLGVDFTSASDRKPLNPQK